MSNQSVTLKASGLNTYPNQLTYVAGSFVQTSTPNGALAIADDIVINRADTPEPRRGFGVYGNEMGGSATLDKAKQLMTYKDRLFRQYANILEWDNGSGQFTAFARAVTEVNTGLRIKYAESNGNLYFTTNNGINKISINKASDLSAANVVDAGMPEALDITLSLNQAPGFFNQESAVAYRVLWGIKDSNQNVILGAPSNRQVIYNPLTPLLAGDFNNLLTILDGIDQVNGIKYGSYFNSFSVPKNASATAVRSSLIALTTQLDNDIESFTAASSINDTTGTTAGSYITDISVSNVRAGQQVAVDVNKTTLSGVTATTTTTTNTLTSLSFPSGHTINEITAGQIVSNVASGIISDGTTVTSVDTGGGIIYLSSIPLVAGTYSSDFIFTNPDPFQTDTEVTSFIPPSTQVVTLSNSTTITGVTTDNLVVGQGVSAGSDFPVGTYIASIGTGTVTTTKAATASGSATVTFSGLANLNFATQFSGTYTNSLNFNSIYAVEAGSIITAANTPAASTNTSTTGISYNVTVVLATDPTSILQIGDPVSLSGVLPTTYNTTTGIVQEITPSAVTFNVQVNPGTYISGTGTLARHKYQFLTQPLSLDNDPFSNELVSLQTYYNSIVTILQTEPAAIVGGISVIAGVSGGTTINSSTISMNTAGISAGDYISCETPGVFPDFNLIETVDTIANTVTIASQATSSDSYSFDVFTADDALFENANPTNTATVNVRFAIPATITTADFYQIYRTQQVSASTGISLDTLDPGDDEYLAFEGNPTAQELAQGFVQVNDIEPDAYLGATLYTNANGGNGITSANLPPPLAKDMTLYKNYMFYANTMVFQSLNTTLLGVANLVSGTSKITVSNGTVSNTYTFVDGVAQVATVATVADVSGALNNKYWTINSANNVNQYYVWYNVNSAGVDPAPTSSNSIQLTGIEVLLDTNDSADLVAQKTANALIKVLDFNQSLSGNVITLTNVLSGICTPPADNNTGFTITVTTTGNGEDAATKQITLSTKPTPAQQIDETARSIVNVINRNPSETIYAFYESGVTDVPGKILLQSRTLGSVAFTLTVDSVMTGKQFNPALPVSGSTVDNTSDNDTCPNRLFYSTQYQPDAVPVVNYVDIGPKDKQILRILALRESLFIFKEEAIYRLTGQVAAAFTVSLFDSSAILSAPDSAAILNNTIYGLSNQGVIQVNDNGVSIISRPIEGMIIQFNSALFPNFLSSTWGIGYESDRTYNLWTVTNKTDTIATQSFRYNTITQAWTRCTKTANCGVINFLDDKMYVGATDINFIEQERKNFDRTDYADRQFDFTINANALSGNVIKLGSLTNVSTGDVILQTQYLTISEFNRLISKLSNDLGIKSNYSGLVVSPGVNLRGSLTSLATELDADAGTHTKIYASSIASFSTSFTDTQGAFNTIISLLNADTGLSFKNYKPSTGTKDFEVAIVGTIKSTNAVETLYAYPFVQGPITVFNHINSVIKWIPQTFGDPSVSKHVSECTMMFEKLGFTSATISFATDLFPALFDQDFPGPGNGSYGNAVYGNTTYGDSGNSIPLRTLVPKNMQRCRYMNLQFTHAVARELFSIFGASLTYNTISQRAWR